MTKGSACNIMLAGIVAGVVGFYGVKMFSPVEFWMTGDNPAFKICAAAILVGAVMIVGGFWSMLFSRE